jgi:hypothetical protein
LGRSDEFGSFALLLRRLLSQIEILPPGLERPPPPPGVRYVWLFGQGHVRADDRLRRRVERAFQWPMIMLALAILPVLVFEFFFLARHPELRGTWIWWVVSIAGILIWVAFLIEFVIKVAIAESRIEYCKRNWIDIVVIVLPVLRATRVVRVARLAKTSRMFRLRGLGMKLLRFGFTAVLGLKATERMLSRFGVAIPTGRKDPRQMTRLELMDELKRRRRQVDAWEQWYQQHELFVRGGEVTELPPRPDLKAAVQAGDDSAPGPEPSLGGGGLAPEQGSSVS